MADQCQWAEGSKKSLHHIFSYPPKKSLINGQIGGSFPYIEVSQYVVEEVGGGRSSPQAFKQNFLRKKALLHAGWNWFLATCIGYLQLQLREMLNQPRIEIIKFAYHT